VRAGRRASWGMLQPRASDRYLAGSQGLSHLVELGSLQWLTAVDIALQLSMRRGTTSADSACGYDIVGRLGLQRIAAGGSALLGFFGAVHHRKTARATSLVCWLGSGGHVCGCNIEMWSAFGYVLKFRWRLLEAWQYTHLSGGNY
jgi:hypothetical protein